MFVKICGITRVEDALLASALGASAVGFVFWPHSPRAIDPSRAREIGSALPKSVIPIGVFVDQPLEFVESVARLAGLGAVQLHGSETPEFARRLALPVIKATTADDLASLAAWPEDVTLLLDAADAEKHGGTGRKANWDAAARLARQRRVLLAGGLRPENVGPAIRAVRPHGVDLSSGIESEPGVKDPLRMQVLFAAIRAARGVAA